MIQIDHLAFGYERGKLLYKDLSLSLSNGNICGLLGKNGAGKSTLLKNMMGLLFPSAGTIMVNQRVPRKRTPSFLQTVYFIPEEVYVPAVSAEGYCRLFAPFYPGFNKAHLDRYLLELDVNKTGKLTELSFGQQKKFIIAFALACNTPVLLLDEPTNGLDIPSKARFRKLVASVMQEERLIVISTHQVRDLENLIDRVIILDDGALLLNASMLEVTERLCFSTVKEIPANRELLYSEQSLGGISVVYENTTGEDSGLNLEQLFNAVTQKPGLVQKIFSNIKQH